MISWLILLSVIFVGLLMIGSLMPLESGYVLINIADFTFESSVVIFLALMILVTAIGYFGLRALMIPVGLDLRFNDWRRKKKQKVARRQTTRGLLALAQGQWRRAERQLSDHAKDSDQPLINYLAAARAAYEQGLHEAADKWLKEASSSTRGSALAVGLTQAELLRSRGQYEQALAVLLRLRRKNSRHAYVLKLLLKTYEDLQDWRSIHELLPNIRRLAKVPADKLQELEEKVAIQQLDAQQNGSAADLRDAFTAIDRTTRHRYSVFRHYIDCLLAKGYEQQAEIAIRTAASKIWNDDLVLIYGTLEVEDINQPLLFAEQQLKSRPNDATLLLTLARLSRRAGNNDKAIEYINMGLKIHGLPALHSELASLLAEQGNTDDACLHYEQALKLT